MIRRESARLANGIGEQMRVLVRLHGASVVKGAPAGDIAGKIDAFHPDISQVNLFFEKTGYRFPKKTNRKSYPAQ